MANYVRFLICFACLASVGLAEGNYTLELPKICSDIFNQQGGQSSPFPYKLELSKVQVKPGESVQVTLKGKDGATFKRFAVHAHSAGFAPFGTFSTNAQYNPTPVIYVNCGSGRRNIITQNEYSDKKEVTFTWTPSSDYKGVVGFYANVFQDENIYWTERAATLIIE